MSTIDTTNINKVEIFFVFHFLYDGWKESSGKCVGTHKAWMPIVNSTKSIVLLLRYLNVYHAILSILTLKITSYRKNQTKLR